MEGRDSDNVMSTAEITSVDDLNRAASSLLRAIYVNHQDNFTDKTQLQQRAFLPKSVEGILPMNVDELLRRVHAQSSDGEVTDEKRDSRTMSGLDSAVYWVGRRPLPVVTEEAIDEALSRLTPHGRALLDESFDAMQWNDLAASRSEVGDSTDSKEKSGKEGLKTYDGNCDGKSMFFGGTLVELVHDNVVWSQGEEKERELLESFHDSAALDSAVPLELHDSPTMIKPACEKERTEYIRNQIRMMLLANCVSEEVECNIASTLLSATLEMKSKWEHTVLSVMERQMGLLQEAARVMHSMQKLNSRAIAEYAKDPYRTQTWMRNEAADKCYKCHRSFSFLVAQHHCRRCGFIFCRRCSSYSGMLPDKSENSLSSSQWARLCSECYEVCCRHQRRVSTTHAVPKSRYERDGRAPEDLSLEILSNCPNPNGTLEDRLPPFLVVLPEEWYVLKKKTASGWLNSVREIPFVLAEGVQESALTFSELAMPRFYNLIKGVSNSLKRIQ